VSAVCAEIDRFGISPSRVVGWITTTTTEEEDSTCVSFKFFQVYIPNRLEFDFFYDVRKKFQLPLEIGFEFDRLLMRAYDFKWN
jgi:hypothetical protein